VLLRIRVQQKAEIVAFPLRAQGVNTEKRNIVRRIATDRGKRSNGGHETWGAPSAEGEKAEATSEEPGDIVNVRPGTWRALSFN